MSKLFTGLMAVIVASAVGVAGYAYYTGGMPCCQEQTSLPSASSATPGCTENEAECEFCKLAREKSCCAGESSAKLKALGGAAPSCCSEGPETTAVSGIVGGFAEVVTFKVTEENLGAPLEAVIGTVATK